MKAFLTSVLVASSLLFTSLANANPPYFEVSGYITKIQIMGENPWSYDVDGKAMAFISLDEIPNTYAAYVVDDGNTTETVTTGCMDDDRYNRVAVGSNHPAFEFILNTALAAKSSNQRVTIRYLERCDAWLAANAWDFSILYITEEPGPTPVVVVEQ